MPLIVIVLAAQFAATPAGKPFAPETPLLAIPVALVVECVILVNVVLAQSVGVEEAAPAVFKPVIVMVGLVVCVKFSTAAANTALALPAPAPVAVNVTVAVPDDCIEVCPLDKVPFTGELNTIG